MDADVKKSSRARLFGASKPTIRAARLFTESGYGEDMGILWAAYKVGSFPLVDNQDMSPDDFGRFIAGLPIADAVIVEDSNNHYTTGRGPIAFIGVQSDGWRHEPHVDYFAWASKRNMLRTTVAFLQFMRYNKHVGVCVIRCLAPHVNLFKRAAKYVTLNYLGRIVNGTPRGDEYMFTVAGKKRRGD